MQKNITPPGTSKTDIYLLKKRREKRKKVTKGN